MSGGGGGGGRAPPPAEASPEEKRLWRAQEKISRGLWNSYRKYGRPIQRQLSREARRPISQGELSSRASMAGADVDQAFDQSGQRLRRELGRHGLSPASGRFAGSLRSLELGRAASKAGAMTGARRSVRAERDAKRFGALSASLGQPAQALSGLQGVSAGMSGLRHSADLAAGRQMQADAARDAAIGNIIGNVGGAAAGAFIMSDRRAKQKIKKVGELGNGLAVYSFEPKGGGAQQIGLMADEVEKVIPGAVAEIQGGPADGLKAVDYERAVQPRQHPRKQRRAGQQERAAETRRQGRRFLRDTLPAAVEEGVDLAGEYAGEIAEHTPRFAKWAAGELEDIALANLPPEMLAKLGLSEAVAQEPKKPANPRKRRRLPSLADTQGPDTMDRARELDLERIEQRIAMMSPEDRERLPMMIEQARRDRATRDGTMSPEEADALPPLYQVASEKKRRGRAGLRDAR